MLAYKVSILIPVYNSSKFIERCAHSVFSQTFESVEYIFVDDCSTDDSMLILNKVIDNYPARKVAVRIITHDVNKGISAARQTAFDKAVGDYFIAMDSDDYIEPTMVELLYKKATEANSDMVYCLFFSESKNKQLVNYPNFKNNKVHLLQQAILGNSAYWNKLILRRILVENKISALNGIDHGDDLIVLAKIIYFSTNFAYLPIPLYHYVEYNVNSTTKKFKPKYIEDRLKLVEDLDKFFSSIVDYQLYQSSIILLKAIRKAVIIRLTNADEKYIGLYPEINSHVFELKLKPVDKLILYLAKRKQIILLKILLMLSNFKTKLMSYF